MPRSRVLNEFPCLSLATCVSIEGFLAVSGLACWPGSRFSTPSASHFLSPPWPPYTRRMQTFCAEHRPVRQSRTPDKNIITVCGFGAVAARAVGVSEDCGLPFSRVRGRPWPGLLFWNKRWGREKCGTRTEPIFTPSFNVSLIPCQHSERWTVLPPLYRLASRGSKKSHDFSRARVRIEFKFGTRASSLSHEFGSGSSLQEVLHQWHSW